MDIVVVGATGSQGGAVAKHLRAGGWTVRALSRSRPGFVHADMEDVASLVAAMEGAHGVFSVQPTVGSPGTAPDFSAEDEVRWGMNVASAAAEAGVRHFVYTSVAGTGRHLEERLPVNLISKWRIEEHIYARGLPATVLRPVSFLENFTGDYALHDDFMATGLAPDVPQQLMAVDDVGMIAAQAFADPASWIGRTVELAGDSVTPVEIAAAFSEVLGRPLPYEQIPLEAMPADFAFANRWLNELGYRVAKLHPGLMNLRTWLHATGAAQLRAASSQSAPRPASAAARWPG
ncbi:NmrA/HSCARG family protein [Lentzea tibetensis]|uniref:NmrA/HSCARG family protein n=1 Tax=Lentzea tibetensis TaxID=2591470 RepID=A0A563EGG1_9PSEU|nr:NmrA/HSCARG family protein [Lentzea tibetensis]TWP45444.1 NmrA/HSCARG family protein [Lentzea tibetensis]